MLLKRNRWFFFMFLVVLFIGIPSRMDGVLAEERDNTILYFYSDQCSTCRLIKDEMDKHLAAFERDGVTVIRYDVSIKENLSLFNRYKVAHNIPANDSEGGVPFLLVGST